MSINEHPAPNVGTWATYTRGSGHAVHGAPPRVILRPLPDGGTTIDVGIWRLDQGDQWRAVYEYCWVPCWHSSDARLVRDLLCEQYGLPDTAAKLCLFIVDAYIDARDQLAAGQAAVEQAYLLIGVAASALLEYPDTIEGGLVDTLKTAARHLTSALGTERAAALDAEVSAAMGGDR